MNIPPKRAQVQGLGATVIAAALFNFGCTMDEGGITAEPFTVRDSAGIEIVTSKEASWDDGAAWTVDAVPNVVIGDDESDPNSILSFVSAAFRLSTGDIVVADRQRGEMLVFSAEGIFKNSIGRRGEGPGEFQSISYARATTADAIWVWDTPLSRRSGFLADGTLLATEQVDTRDPAAISTDLPANTTGVQIEGTLEDGTVVGFARLAQSAMLSGEDRIYQATSPLILFGPSGTPAQVVGGFRDSQYWVYSGSSGLLPFGERRRLATSHRTIAVTAAIPYQIQLLDGSGEVTRVIQRTNAFEATTPEAIEAFREAWLGRFADPTSVQAWTDQVPWPSEIRTIESMIWDSEENLWVEHYIPPHRRGDDVPTPWDVFNTRGAWLGTVQIPSGLDIMFIGSDDLIAVFRNNLDVQMVGVFPIVRE